MKALMQYELKKIFSRGLTQVILLVLISVSIFLSVSAYQNKYVFDGVSNEGSGRTAVQIDKKIASKYEGILTTEKVREMMSDFAPHTDLHGLNAIYLYRNAFQSSVFARFSDQNGNWNGKSVEDIFGDEIIKIGYTEGWRSVSENLIKIIILLSASLIVIISPVFSGEYGGVDNLILSSRYGRTKCIAAKVFAGFLTALAVTIIILGVNFSMGLFLYGTDGLDCSILFAPLVYIEGGIPYNITMGTLLLYQAMLAFTAAVSVTGITLFCSAAAKKQITALSASAAFYLFPMLAPVSETSPVFRIIGLLPIYQGQFTSLMSVSQINNRLLYAIMAVPAALVLFAAGAIFSRRFFAGHEVSA